MRYSDPGIVMEELDMDEQQLILTCLIMTLGTEKVHEIATQTAAMLRENNRGEAAGMLEEAARKLTL